MNVAAVKPGKKDGQGFVKFDDDTEAWTPELAKVEPLVGKPVPDGWTLKDGPYGKQLLPPKEGSGKTAWRNTKEGFLAEQEGRQRWQKVEEERRDRRTALMQAVQVTAYLPYDDRKRQADKGHAATILTFADEMYAWLTNSASGGSETRVENDRVWGRRDGSTRADGPPEQPSEPMSSVPSADEPAASRPEQSPETTLGGEEPAGGNPADATAAPTLAPPSAAGCDHEWTSTKPAGGPMPRGKVRCVKCGVTAVEQTARAL